MNHLQWMIPLAVPVLLAQNPQDEVKPDPAPGATLGRLKSHLKKGRGRLLIRPAGDDAFWQRLMALLKLEPLNDMDIPTETLQMGTRLEQDVAESLRLEPGPCWLLVDTEFKVLCQGREVPQQPEGLAATLQAAGWKSSSDQLVAFIARHPDHLVAQALRIRHLGGQVWTQLRPLLTESLALRRPLTAAEDEQIFGAYARALEVFLRDPAFPTTSMELPFANLEDHSALFREVAQRCRPMVEAKLRRQPNRADLWTLWSRLETLGPSTDALAFVTSLPQVEGDAYMLQGYHLLPPLRRAALHTGRWADLLPLAFRAWAFECSPTFMRFSPPDFRATWDMGAGLAVECLLRLRRTAEATGILQDFLDCSRHEASATWAAALAKDLGHPDLVESWSRLRPLGGAGAQSAGSSEESPGLGGVTFGLPDTRPLRYLLAGSRSLRFLFLDPSDAPPWNGQFPSPEQRPRIRACDEIRNYLLWNYSLLVDWLRLDSVAGRELCAQQGWGPEPRWVLVDPTGKVLEHGTTPPTPEHLASLLGRHGLKPRHERVERLLEVHPDHLEGLREHFRIHMNRGVGIVQRQEYTRGERERWDRERQALAEYQDPAFAEARIAELRPIHGADAEKIFESNKAAALKNHAPSPPKIEIGDSEPEFEEAARLLRQLVMQPDWAYDPTSSEMGVWIPGEAFNSPAFKRVAASLQVQVEALLLRTHSLQAWQLWMGLSGLTGASPHELMARIPKVPNEFRTVYNANYVHGLVAKALTQQKRWKALTEWVTGLWESWLSEPADQRNPVFPHLEDAIVAELMLQHTDRAEAWVEKQLAESPSMNHDVLNRAEHAARLAGHKDLAQTWRERQQAIQKAWSEKK